MAPVKEKTSSESGYRWFRAGGWMLLAVGLLHLVTAVPMDLFPSEYVGKSAVAKFDSHFIGFGGLLRSPREVMTAFSAGFGLLTAGMGVVTLMVSSQLQMDLRRKVATFLAVFNLTMMGLHFLYSPWPPIILTTPILVVFAIAAASSRQLSLK